MEKPCNFGNGSIIRVYSRLSSGALKLGTRLGAKKTLKLRKAGKPEIDEARLGNKDKFMKWLGNKETLVTWLGNKEKLVTWLGSKDKLVRWLGRINW